MLMRMMLGLVATALFLGAALAWLAVLRAAGPELDADELGDLRAELGIAMTLFTVALCPAIIEELAFRGLLQGRIAALWGERQSILLTGVAFALGHGVTAASPLHLGLGLYLGSLRARSGSLLPGMVLHFCYNAVLVSCT